MRQQGSNHTVTQISLSMIKKNKSRSILIAISIFLTTVLLMVIASYGYGPVSYTHLDVYKRQAHGEGGRGCRSGCCCEYSLCFGFRDAGRGGSSRLWYSSEIHLITGAVRFLRTKSCRNILILSFPALSGRLFSFFVFCYNEKRTN